MKHSPFAFFRKHQRVGMVALTVMAMFAFVFLDSTFQRDSWFNTSFAEKTGVNIKGGSLSQNELANLVNQRVMVNRFITEAIVAVRTEDEKNKPTEQQLSFEVRRNLFGVEWSANPESDEAVMWSHIMRLEARRMGLRVTDPMVESFIQRITEHKLSSTMYQKILKQSGIRERSLYDGLQQELLARLAWQLCRPMSDQTPDQYWANYRRMKVKQNLELAALPVNSFIGQVETPSKTVLQAFFDEHKGHYAETGIDPARPGFRELDRARIQYLTVSYTTLEKSVKEPTDKDVTDYYEQKKDTLYRDLTALEDVPDDKATDGKPADEKAADKATENATDKPAAEPTTGTEGDKKPTTEGAKPDASAPVKPQTVKPEATKTEPRKTESPKSESPPAPTPEEKKPTEEKKPEEKKPNDSAAEEKKPCGDDTDNQATEAKKSADESPASDKPTAEKASDAKPSEDKKTEDIKAEDKKPDEKSTESTESTKPTPEKPAAEKPAAEKPTSETPPVEKPSTDKTAPAKASEAQPKSAPKATTTLPPAPELAPEDTPEAKSDVKIEKAPPRYKPLTDTLKDQIRDGLLRERTEAARKKLADDALKLLNAVDPSLKFNLPMSVDGNVIYLDENEDGIRDANEVSFETKEKVDPDNLMKAPAAVVAEFQSMIRGEAATLMKKVAKQLKLTYSATEALTAEEVEAKDGLGKVVDLSENEFQAGGASRLLENVFVRDQNYQPRAGRDTLTEDLVIYWRAEHIKSHIPTFTEPGIEEKVIAAWKLTKAYPLAVKRAEELAKKVGKQKLADALKGQTVTGDSKSKPIVVNQTSDFSWLSPGTPTPNSFGDSPPMMSTVDFTTKIGEEFMQVACEDLGIGESGFAPNRDKSTVYIMRVVNREPKPGEETQRLRETFMKEQSLFGMFNGMIPSAYSHIANQSDSRMYFEWMESLRTKYQLKWADPERNE